jgi:amino acid adenylation domain-containing protein/non-ribosomal peptide synthase protein (TIGR01720 family)
VLDGAPSAPPTAPLPAPATRAIHDRIADRAAATPGALAVRCEDEAISYAELEDRAHRLVDQLRELGVGPGGRVGLCLARSIDFVVALYATLLGGAAYVPLDPAQPDARLAGLVRDAALSAVVTRDARRAAFDGLVPVVCRDDPSSRAGRPRTRTAVHPEAPAYLIFTSGSTGTPKGVVVSHRALDNYVTGVIERLGLPACASMAMVSTVAADLGHTALFGALCTGGTLHLITDERAADPEGFADYMTRHEVAALKIVPGHLWGLMQTAAPERALPAQILVIGGEAAPPALLEVLRRQTRCRVINHYGPTETTVGILTQDLASTGAALALGRPLPHTRACVLGPALRPMPVGAPGEIYLGGRGLAAGYFGRPALTADRFVPDPRSGEPGARLYRTGDRGRLRGDGAIEFLGRADDQIKLRGFRIEPGEIRAELVRLPGVRDARVVVRPGPAGAPQLVAYLIGAAADRPAPEAQLRARLPEAMVPAAYVWLDRFPVTANGKIDLARLPAPGAAIAAPAAAAPAPDREPATDAERALAAIWREVLGCPAIGRDAQFFQLGGDSILALKVVARARRAGWKLTPKQLHAHPTLAEAARVAQRIVAAPIGPASPPAAPATVRLTPIQLRFLERQQIDPHHYNQAILLALAAPIAPDVLAHAVRQLTEHHAALRLRFARGPDGWRYDHADPPSGGMAGAAPGYHASPDRATGEPVVHLDLTTAVDPASEIDRACDELQHSFDLSRGPLLRMAYFDLGPGREPRLLLIAHHLVVDGVSWRILLEDLAELVAGAPALAAPTTAFQDFAEQLHRHAQAPALHGELAYWQRVVAPHPDDRGGDDRARRGSNTVGDAATVSAELDLATTAVLRSRAPQAIPIHDLLLAALGRVLCRSWRRASVLVTVEGHGREELFDGVELSRTVGWFSTLYPVRLTPADPGGTTGASVRAIADQLRQVPAHGIGYGLLRQLAPGSLLSAGDEPRVTFNYLGQFDPTAGSPSHPTANPVAGSAPSPALAGRPQFRIAPETTGRRRSPHTPRDGWFVVNAIIHDGALIVDWEYSRALHDRGEAQRLLDDYLSELRAVAAWCEAIQQSTERTDPLERTP